MQYRITIEGHTPILMHDIISGMDTTSAVKQEIASITGKRGKRTVSDESRIRELEAFASIWRTTQGEVGIPERALRSMIEVSAKTLKQGAQVRQGLRVTESHFDYDRGRYGVTMEEIAKNAQYTIPVRVQRASILRTRAKIDTPWSCIFMVNVSDELVDRQHLEEWLRIGGSQIGLGDWRPATSGNFGVFALSSIQSVDAC